MSATCGTNSCTSDAVCRAFWPGREPITLCEPCKEKAVGVSHAMGFYLHIEDISRAEETKT